jgi:hypothetical protein
MVSSNVSQLPLEPKQAFLRPRRSPERFYQLKIVNVYKWQHHKPLTTTTVRGLIIFPAAEIGGQRPRSSALVDHGPVVTNVYLTSAFHAYRAGVFAERAAPPVGAPGGSHSLVIVGWDDRKGREGCWKVENSWGTGWGERGFMWIEYGSNTIDRNVWWVCAQATQYDLPVGIENLVDPPVAPFPKWPDARPVKLPVGR